MELNGLSPAQLLHTGAALAAVVLLAVAGRGAARWVRLPEVVGEVTAGLVVGPVLLALLGAEVFGAVLPGPVLANLKVVGEAGLVLFLVGMTHRLRSSGGARSSRRALPVLAAWALVLPLAAGLLLVAVVEAGGDPAVRGTAPLPAFVLMVAVAMSITAVPVLSRILVDRGMTDTTAGSLALGAAIVIDGVGWVLLTVAVGLGTGSASGLVGAGQALLFAAVVALALRWVLRAEAVRRYFARRPWGAALLIGAVTLATALETERLGLTAVVGAALIGLGVPREEPGPWEGAVARVSRWGLVLTPVFFVVTGVSVLTKAFAATSWTLITATLVLGLAGKLVGGYVGARRGGLGPAEAMRVGALMNTRGLTELIVLQAGYRAGILSAPLMLALVVMALATTAATGPLLGLVNRTAGRAGPVDGRTVPAH
ncbi:antiporter Na+ or K+/H+ exchanger [Streptomyces spiroverticillatus]|uniref:Antiporter Na+ or K+/H+ exchanger n=1 Tax=Streptomyces finlayi TaxID=67296 RepID=A0A918X010_9ACTN|nr:cation:proton antiporter [Streptomyces finlayi]GHA12874.1 antiporter Na+ or K+/H+ exchanger [Streptomyces spiroverticillatus]GHC98295.1 antiporter Na+ or K+/H+ exchanger [Streptomyces finlayi]